MGALWSSLFGNKEKPIKGSGPKLKNLFSVHFRGIFGGFLPLIPVIVGLVIDKNNHSKSVMIMWIWMAWCFFIQPVNIPVTGMIPIFLMPMTCSMSTDKVVGSYMNEGIALFIVGNMLLLLWNNSGLDRRLILWFLSSGDASQCSAAKLIFKCSVGGFFLSMVSNRLIICNIMTEYVSEVMTGILSYSAKRGPDMLTVKYILNNVIQTSCALGGIPIVHASYCTLAFRAIFYETAPRGLFWPDIFNYLQYTIFAFPTALLMLIFNIIYHNVLMRKAATGMTPALLMKIKDSFMTHKKSIPKKITLHQILSIIFLILSLAAFFLRYSKYWIGWSVLSVKSGMPGIRDATVAVAFVVLLHALPSGCRFIKIWSAKKKSHIGPLRPDSAILWWRFVDKNITYGYIFVIGSGVALTLAVEETNLVESLQTGIIGKIFNQRKELYYLLICFFTVLLANVMSGVPVIVIFLPIVIHSVHTHPETTTSSLLRQPAEATPFPRLDRIFLGSLAVGIGASCGFANPFLYTPAFFCHYTGKSPRLQMAKYGAGSAVICFIVLWMCITFLAPLLWGSDIHVFGGATTVVSGAVTTTTPATRLMA